MNDAKQAALAAIEEKKDLIADVADAVWDYAELSSAPQEPSAPDASVMKRTVMETLADAPVPKDEEDVRTMSLEALLKDIHDM